MRLQNYLNKWWTTTAEMVEGEFMRLCLQLVQRKSSEADTEAMREEFQQRISSAERKASS